MKKNAYTLEGLTCANCAGKIEQRVTEIEGFKDVSLNFATQTLSFTATEENYQSLLQKEVDAIEHGVTVAIKKARGHGHNDDNEQDRKVWIRLVIGALLFAVGLMLPMAPLPTLIAYLLAFITIGGDVLLRAVKNIAKGHVFDENFLMSVATIGAFAIGEYPEGVTVMLFYQIGELFQNRAVQRSRHNIAALMDIRPDVAWVYQNQTLKQVPAAMVAVGESIVVKPGERVPLDGLVLEGTSNLDTSALTGEPLPKKVTTGEVVLSGVVNQTGILTIEVQKAFGESTVSKILNLVETAGNKKAPTEKFISKFARVYTPVVVYMALAIAVIPPIILGGGFSDWVHRALIFLVVSCPCALVISIPLGFFGGIGGASKHGILIKGGNFLEAMNQVDTVVFDKTGTLTHGDFSVVEVVGVNHSREEVLSMAAVLERHSNHPIAKSIMQAYGSGSEEQEVVDFEEVSGQGLKGLLQGEQVYVGNRVLMTRQSIEVPQVEAQGTVVYVAYKGLYIGHILIADSIKADSYQAIQDLKAMGIKQVVMLTGDREASALKVGEALGIDQVFAALLPHEKVEKLESLLKEKGKTIFVGDGINDAPVLARADIGVAMGGIGSDAAIEAADIVLMTDEPSKLVDALKVAKRTRRIVWQNIGFAMGVKAIVLILGAGGLATMWEAVFADVGVALIAIMNAMRVIRKPIG